MKTATYLRERARYEEAEPALPACAAHSRACCWDLSILDVAVSLQGLAKFLYL